MTGYPHFSVYVLALSFASLVLGKPALSASAEQASPGLLPSHPSSIDHPVQTSSQRYPPGSKASAVGANP